MAWEERCSTVITQWRWAPPSTNCPTTSTTNYSWCPDWVTNWWVVSHPGYSASDRGTYVPRFQPTNCGTGTITFYGVWTNNHPCGDTNAVLGGTTSISKNFTVVNVDIAEDEKTVCACETANFTLTNSCGGAVTWEVVPNGLPGEPYVSGNSIIAGTNCGSWLVLARSTVNSNCLDYAWLHVFTVAGLAPEGLTRQGTNEPPTYITCPRATNAVDRWLRVMATSCPGVWEAASCTNLPPSRR
ncbi:MAG: hypothetical protein N3I86_07210 [Verrucomicrobiae bacterium]|nr:hypothetical protein [Verrucomicrobiae bacterium]